MASHPTTIHYERPYQSVEELVDAEGWAIGKGTFVLVGHEELATDTVVRCDLVLQSGEHLLRAEGVVVRTLAARGNRPGGAQLKIQRLTPASRDFLQRVQRLKEQSPKKPDNGGSVVPPVSLSSRSLTPPVVRSLTPPAVTELPGTAQHPPNGSSNGTSQHPPLTRLAERKAVLAEPPPKRDALLERLRARYRSREASITKPER